ncbi:hypothetical protein EBZ70_02145 [bacterium]|nr:hypothetical protein [bacterium]
MRAISRWLSSALLTLPALVAVAAQTSSKGPSIDRESLVARHSPRLRGLDYDSPLTVGNGGFAFTADVTGLQTFPAEYQRAGVPVETMSRWAWACDENPAGYVLADANRDFVHPDGTVRGYPTVASGPAGQWLRKNPRIHPLGQIALDWDKPGGGEITPEDIRDIDQRLDLWRGVIHSRYTLNGYPVTVATACLPDSDTVLLRLESDLVASGSLGFRLAFPRGHDLGVKNTPGYDWSAPESHRSEQVAPNLVQRRVPGLDYAVALNHPAKPAGTPHTFLVRAEPGRSVLSLAIRFSQTAVSEPVASPDFERVARHWESFWRTSAAADFTGSTSPLAEKLERRIVLSQYLTAVQMAGESPPQESGLTCATWYGKHHTEMIWWHAAHFALWGRPELLARNLDWYANRLPEARAIATGRGLRGARWAKMTGPDLRESPGGNPLIVWNQPHPVYLAELLRRSDPGGDALERYAALVQETADCLASMLWLDPARDRYVLGPPLWIAQEIYDPATSRNPGFELAYWRWALGVAQSWRERRGLAREPLWDDIIARISPLPEKDGKYVALESHPDTWENVESRHDHPSMLMSLGVLPATDFVDRATMQRTLDAVLRDWDWETKIWGWDYPMIAMTAARLGRPEVAVDILLRDGPNNRYLPNGHCPQRSDEKQRPGQPRREIAVYLPANGSFLSAAALMLGGWDGASRTHPGIPQDGAWTVRAEGWQPLP